MSTIQFRSGRVIQRRCSIHSRVRSLTAALSLFAWAGSASAVPIIDGSIADWGLTRTGQASDWTPNSGVQGHTVDDQTGGTAVYLNPGFGGQRYDAEAIYVTWDASNLYVLAVTGLPNTMIHNPANGHYAAGDILLDFGNNGSFEYGLVVRNIAGLTPGGVYEVGTLSYGIWATPGVRADVNNPSPYAVAVKTGAKVGDGQLSYSVIGNSLGMYSTDTHYAIEASIPLLALGDDWGKGLPLSVQWTMYCANDIISTTVTTPTGRVPEPGIPGLIAAVLVAGCARGIRFLKRR